jgi:hypothetical protein
MGKREAFRPTQQPTGACHAVRREAHGLCEQQVHNNGEQQRLDRRSRLATDSLIPALRVTTHSQAQLQRSPLAHRHRRACMRGHAHACMACSAAHALQLWKPEEPRGAQRVAAEDAAAHGQLYEQRQPCDEPRVAVRQRDIDDQPAVARGRVHSRDGIQPRDRLVEHGQCFFRACYSRTGSPLPCLALAHRAHCTALRACAVSARGAPARVHACATLSVCLAYERLLVSLSQPSCRSDASAACAAARLVGRM